MIKVPDARTGESLYQAELKSSLNGTNPFTGNADSVTTITDLILWNVNPGGLSFDDDHGGTLTLLLSRSLPNIGNNSTAAAAGGGVEETVVDLETIKFGRSQFPYNGTIVLADVAPPLHVVGGHVLLNLPSNDAKLCSCSNNQC